MSVKNKLNETNLEFIGIYGLFGRYNIEIPFEKQVNIYIGENGLPVRFKPDQLTSPMYRQTIQFQQQRVDEARVRREGNPLPQFSNKDGYTPPDLTKPFGYGSANYLPSNIYAGGK